MANPLTGDFEAVLQVSGATINRLLASMHQNDGAKPELPSFPHSVALRIGTPQPIDGLAGTIWAQVSVPRIELVHAVSDRFKLEVDIRARYQPDPGSTPLPEFIHGTVRAEYRIHDIDPSCLGWKSRAADYVWIRVVGSSVTFDGTAVDDEELWAVSQAGDAAANDARITRLVRHLLTRQFQATPQRVERRFRRGSMVSLNTGVNKSVVAVPLQGQGQLSSITQALLDNYDFGVAVDAAAILAPLQAELDALQQGFSLIFTVRHRETFVIDWVTVNISWKITLSQVKAEWTGGFIQLLGNVGLVTIKIVGHARTQKPEYNWDFEASHLVMVTLDTATEALNCTPIGSPSVSITGPFASDVEDRATPKIAEQVKDRVKTEADKLAGLFSFKDRKQELIDQLAKLDDQANAWLENALFTPDGVVIRGRISLAARRPPVAAFDKTSEGDGFTGFQSWVPGGRIDALEWSWRWGGKASPPGAQTHTDRFLLRRPGGTLRGRFGGPINLHRPLPILDGAGRVCLALRGSRVDPVTGNLAPAPVVSKCRHSIYDVRIAGRAIDHRLFLKEWRREPRDPIGPVAEESLIDVRAARTGAPGANTLLVFAGERWTPEATAMIGGGLEAARRSDAGLIVLVLFAEGRLGAMTEDAAASLARLSSEAGASVEINEDVRGNWSRAMGVDSSGGEMSWRLVTPTGGVIWAHRGPIDPRELGAALDDYLVPSGPPSIRPLEPDVKPGDRFSPAALTGGWLEQIGDMLEMEPRCPPLPIARLGVEGHAVFAQGGSDASRAMLDRMAREHRGDDEGAPFVAVVLEGTEEDVRRVTEAYPDFTVIADPQGAVATGLGIRAWPTSIRVAQGIVTSVDVGGEPGRRTPGPEVAS